MVKRYDPEILGKQLAALKGLPANSVHGEYEKLKQQLASLREAWSRFSETQADEEWSVVVELLDELTTEEVNDDEPTVGSRVDEISVQGSQGNQAT